MTRSKGTRKIRRLKRHHGKLYAVLSCGHVVQAIQISDEMPKEGTQYPCRICANRKKT